MIAGVLLAAGESSRMGQLKALLPWRGTTLLQSQAASLLDAGLRPLVVVLGHRSEDLRPLLTPAELPSNAGEDAVRVVVNERYREGKSTSIVAGISALPPETEAAVVSAVDQPCDTPILAALIRAYAERGGPLLLPSVNHRRGHPTLFDSSIFAELRAISEDREGLREVMLRHEADIRYVEVDTDLVRANLNSPAEYEAAHERWGRAG